VQQRRYLCSQLRNDQRVSRRAGLPRWNVRVSIVRELRSVSVRLDVLFGCVLPVGCWVHVRRPGCPCTASAMGTHYAYTIDQLVVPKSSSEARMYGLDLNGDGTVDNAFAAALASLYSQGQLDVAATTAGAVARAERSSSTRTCRPPTSSTPMTPASRRSRAAPLRTRPCSATSPEVC
jgi:hypothetical protein